MMISVSQQVRPAESSDHRQIANLMFFEAHMHRHLDWRTPLEWLGSAHYWVADDQGRVTAALACPQDPPGVAWIRLFTYNSHLSGLEAWSPLWTAARGGIARVGGARVAAIAVKVWFQHILQSSGFEKLQSIVMLEWTARLLDERPLPPGINIRSMRADDLMAITDVDAAAFESLWHNSYCALEMAYKQALCATVAEAAGRVVGYQISTGNPLGAHLARLAVRPEAQGRGVGAALVNDLILRLSPRHIARISVNTQADNAASLALYRKIGFVPTGEQFPVYVYPVGAE